MKTRSAPTRRRLGAPLLLPLLAALAALAAGVVRGAGAQLVTPTSHWGGIMLPDLEDRAEYGLHFLGFTEFGKEVDAAGRYLFRPYNDFHQTLGFNILSYSRTSNGIADALGRSRRGVDPGPLSLRRTFIVGVINDRIPRALQNDVIHRTRFGDRLRRIPREETDVDENGGISLGREDYSPPLLGWSDEFFLRLFFSRRQEGDEQRLPTTLFVGGGWQLSTINHELFAHLGSTVYDARLPAWAHLGPVLRLNSIGVGGMARAGVLKPASHMRDLTSHYANVQSVLRANMEFWSYATQLELSLTAATGYFVATRTAQQRELIGEFDDSIPEKRYQAKTAVNELLGSFRVRIGDFTFETYNDSYGGKDKGPSFGAHVTFNVYNPGERFPYFGPWARRPEGRKEAKEADDDGR